MAPRSDADLPRIRCGRSARSDNSRRIVSESSRIASRIRSELAPRALSLLSTGCSQSSRLASDKDRSARDAENPRLAVLPPPPSSRQFRASKRLLASFSGRSPDQRDDKARIPETTIDLATRSSIRLLEIKMEQTRIIRMTEQR